MTSEDYNELAEFVERSVGTLTTKEDGTSKTIAVVFNTHLFVKLLRERAKGAISVPTLLLPETEIS